MRKTTTTARTIADTPIKGIIFDLDNTLYRDGPAHLIGLRASHKLYPVRSSFDVFHNKYIAARIANEKALRGTGSSHNRILYFQRMLESDNCFSPQKATELASGYWFAFIDGMKLEPQLRELLVSLVRKYKLGILSDLTADIQFSKLSAHRLWPFFDAVVTSEEAGVEKPSTHGLKILLRKMGLRAKDVIIVGDNPSTDGLCANRAGIRFIQIIRQDMKNKESGHRPWLKIQKLSQLRKIL